MQVYPYYKELSHCTTAFVFRNWTVSPTPPPPGLSMTTGHPLSPLEESTVIPKPYIPQLGDEFQ